MIRSQSRGTTKGSAEALQTPANEVAVAMSRFEDGVRKQVGAHSFLAVEDEELKCAKCYRSERGLEPGRVSN